MLAAVVSKNRGQFAPSIACDTEQAERTLATQRDGWMGGVEGLRTLAF